MAEKRRMERLPGGRKNTVKVMLSDAERAELVRRAEAAQLSVPRLLVEAGLAGERRTRSQRQGVTAEFLGVRRLVAAIGNNLNQVTRALNATGRAPEELPVVVEVTGRILERLDQAVTAVRKS
ncbi:hypothetical protein GCM10027589_16560 [Actinocorallia lasiicapitis]